MPAIAFTNVTKRYEHEIKDAVHDVSFAVQNGEFVCLIGPSGGGKSTILRIIAGLDESTSGSVVVPKNVSMAFQQGALFPWLTVFDNVALGLRQQKHSLEAIRERVEAELGAMQLQDFAKKYPAELSGGQKQRVGIARALAVDPKVLLLDEPFSALDPKITAELHDDIIKVWKERKMTVVMVSHLIEEAVSLAGRIMLLKGGTIDRMFLINLPYPRRESEHFHREVMSIRREFFK